MTPAQVRRHLPAHLRRALPGWHAPPVKGALLASISDPSRSQGVRVYVRGHGERPRPVKMRGVTYPPNPLAVECWERSREGEFPLIAFRVDLKAFKVIEERGFRTGRELLSWVKAVTPPPSSPQLDPSASRR